MIRFFLAIAFALPFWAQSWEDLRGLKTGDSIRVLDQTGRQKKGAFKALSGDSISLETSKGEIAVNRTNVRRVEVRSEKRRLRNVVIGALAGVAVGAVVDQTLGVRLRNESSGDGGRAITYAASIGGLGGLFAAMPAYRTIYRVR